MSGVMNGLNEIVMVGSWHSRTSLKRARRIRLVGSNCRSSNNHPYDAILVTAAASAIPGTLAGQLRKGGRLVIPVGSHGSQHLVQARKEDRNLKSRVLFDCQFVPLLGRYG
jgi:protein-L-isoaspartate(D-aspartate) O-methyltransferase